MTVFRTNTQSALCAFIQTGEKWKINGDVTTHVTRVVCQGGDVTAIRGRCLNLGGEGAANLTATFPFSFFLVNGAICSCRRIQTQIMKEVPGRSAPVRRAG